MPSQKESYQSADSAIKSKRARLPAIMLKSDFYSKPRNRIWIAENGAEAVLILQTIWIACSQERDCKVRKTEVAGISFPVSVKLDRVIAILSSAVSVGLLEEDSDSYFNSQVLEDHKSYEVKRNNYAEARKKRERKQGESSENPARIQEESTQNHIVYVDECVNEHESGSKKEWSLPPPFDTDLISKPLASWAKKLWSCHRQKLDQITAEAYCVRFKTPEKLRDALIFSCSLTNPKNLIDPPDSSKAHGKQTHIEHKPAAPVKLDPVVEAASKAEAKTLLAKHFPRLVGAE